MTCCDRENITSDLTNVGADRKHHITPCPSSCVVCTLMYSTNPGGDA